MTNIKKGIYNPTELKKKIINGLVKKKNYGVTCL